jgi:hypothetical protein
MVVAKYFSISSFSALAFLSTGLHDAINALIRQENKEIFNVTF